MTHLLTLKFLYIIPHLVSPSVCSMVRVELLIFCVVLCQPLNVILSFILTIMLSVHLLLMYSLLSVRTTLLTLRLLYCIAHPSGFHSLFLVVFVFSRPFKVFYPLL